MLILSLLCVFAAAIFSVPSVITVLESDGSQEVCITMTTIPVNATLATDANLTLTSRNGSGIILKGSDSGHLGMSNLLSI